MNPVIILLVILSGISYLIFIAFLIFGWRKIRPFKSTTTGSSLFISLVVAFRNEEKNLGPLLHCLLNQQYDPLRYEVILVNDHSTDHSTEMVASAAAGDPRIKLFELPDGLSGKKAAIASAVSHAKGSLVICTDADCTMDHEWIKTVAAFYLDTGHKLIIGPVDYNTDKKFTKNLLNLEFLSLIGTGAGTAGIGHPILCNGANLSFEQSMYPGTLNDLNPSIASGDDIMFMLLAKKRKHEKIGFLKSRKAIVYTAGPLSFGEFINQRKRWAAKSFTVRDTDTRISSSIIGAMNVLLVLLAFGSLFYPSCRVFFACLLLTKGIADAVFIGPVLRFFDKLRLMKYIPLLELVYPWYVCLTGIMSLTGKYNWKSRIYSK